MSYQFILATPVLGPLSLTATTHLLRTVFKVWPTQALDDAEPYMERLRHPERARASGLYYRTFLTRELPATLAGRYRGQEPSMPVLRLMGSDDFIRKLAGDEPGTILIADAGHFVAEEQPEAVLRELQKFLINDERPPKRPSAASKSSRT
jgi:pimeloyl-ACP methyl ester carboxylesterase